jgi:NAD(P)-dependent dehydrogenase (short-subunit alcohol dehydrogenase family)
MSTDADRSHVLVIGGSHGISVEIVKSLLARGVRVTAVSRTRGELETLQASADASLEHISLDVMATQLAPEQLPQRLSGFVYCPGSINLAPLKSVKLQQARDDFELNVVGAMHCFQSALPALKASANASAVFFSTVAVDHGLAMHSYVAAAKGALQALVKTWAAELAPTIRVNCIAPALTDTPLAGNLLATAAKRQAMAEKYPLGRFGTPRDIAAAANFLLSSESDWMTGQVLRVDGGMSSVVRL